MKEKKNTVRTLVGSAVTAALVCVATMLIKVPSPINGYVNLGDCVVLLCGFMLPPLYAFLAAGIGSGLADLFSGYVVYAPVSFAIKGLSALTTLVLLRFFSHRLGNTTSAVLAAAVAECVMMLGYYVFEGVLYGFSAALLNIPANAVQGVLGVALGAVLKHIFEKSRISFL